MGFRAKITQMRARRRNEFTNAPSPLISPPRELPLPAILPYDSPIFVCVQEGDLGHTRELLISASAHINTVDPFGLPLLYVSKVTFFWLVGTDLSSTRHTTAVVPAV